MKNQIIFLLLKLKILIIDKFYEIKKQLFKFLNFN